MSKVIFQAIFKQIYGNTPHTHIKNYKVNLAAIYLQETEQSITQIAGELGYSDISKSARVFQGVFGLLPRDYRKAKKLSQLLGYFRDLSFLLEQLADANCYKIVAWLVEANHTTILFQGGSGIKQTVKKKIGVRDIMTIAAMMVISFAIAMVIDMVILPFPIAYLYGSAGIDAFIGAAFYLVAADRINKHGLLFAWTAVYGLIQGVMGCMFLVPYFLVIAPIAKLCMVDKNTYQNTVHNRIGWMANSIGNLTDYVVPLWRSWDSYQEMAASSDFGANTLNIQFSMVTSPALMVLGVAITAVLVILGILFGQRSPKKRFQKAGIVG